MCITNRRSRLQILEENNCYQINNSHIFNIISNKVMVTALKFVITFTQTYIYWILFIHSVVWWKKYEWRYVTFKTACEKPRLALLKTHFIFCFCLFKWMELMVVKIQSNHILWQRLPRPWVNNSLSFLVICLEPYITANTILNLVWSVSSSWLNNLLFYNNKLNKYSLLLCFTK